MAQQLLQRGAATQAARIRSPVNQRPGIRCVASGAASAPPLPRPTTGSSTVNAAEVAHFAKLAQEWWRRGGPYDVLHRITPLRMRWACTQICLAYGRDPDAFEPLAGLRVLDVGSGGGLVSEPLARLGASVVGVDATEENTHVAAAHAARDPLLASRITYRHAAAETLVAEGDVFDAVLAYEVVEHVDNVPLFVQSLARLTAPGGVVLMSTINRTAKSYAAMIAGAEYLLHWVPIGTHDWNKFITPQELAQHMTDADLQPGVPEGMVFDPFSWRFQMTLGDVDVNYFLSAAVPVPGMDEDPFADQSDDADDDAEFATAPTAADLDRAAGTRV